MTLEHSHVEGATPSGGLDEATRHFISFRSTGSLTELEGALLLCAPALMRAATRLVRSANASDVVQECFATAIHRAPTFDTRRPLLPWLLGILRNVANSRHQRRWARLVRFDDNQLDIRAPSGQERLERDEWYEAAARSIERLPERYRQVLVAHLLQHERLISISRRLCLAEGTVRARLARGLAQLRRQLPPVFGVGIAAVLAARQAEAGTAPVSLPGGSALPKLGMLGLLAAAVWTPVALLSEPSSGAGIAPAEQLVGRAITASSGEPDLPPSAAPRTKAEVEAPAAVASLRLKLNFPDGAPADHVPIALQPFRDPTPGVLATGPLTRGQWCFALSDAQGVADFPALMPATYGVFLDDTSSEVARITLHDEAADHSLVVLQRSLQSVQVVDDAGPVAGASIYVEGLASRGCGFRMATTAATGLASFRMNAPFSLWATVPGRAASARSFVDGHQTTAAGPQHTLVLATPVQICRGRVTDDAGSPVSGATVAVWTVTTFDHGPSYCLTDARGEYVADEVPVGEWQASASARGMATAVLAVQSSDSRGDIRLTRGESVVGVIPFRPDEVAGPRAVVVKRWPHDIRDPLSQLFGTSDHLGRFEIANVGPGQYEVAAFDPDLKVKATAGIVVVEGRATEVALVPVARCPLAVSVEDELGRPVANCMIRAVVDRGSHGKGEATAILCDAGGVARLTVAADLPHLLQVHVAGPDGPELFPITAASTAAGAEQARIRIRSDTQGKGRVILRVLADIPEPERGVTVVLTREGVSQELRLDVPAAQFGPLRVGRYEVAVHRRGDGETMYLALPDIEIRAGEATVCSTEGSRLGTIQLSVPEGSSRAPLRCVLRDDAGNEQIRFDAAPGSRQSFRVRVGSYEVEYPGEAGRPLRARVEVAEQGVSEVSLLRHSGSLCEVVVAFGSDPGNTPPVASVRPIGVDGPACPVALDHDLASLTARGLIDLAAGNYVLEVCSNRGQLERHEFTVPADGTTVRLHVRLP